MRRFPLALASLVIAMACWAAPAQGQGPSRDSVIGDLEEELQGFFVTWTFDVSSGPQGENPTGTVDNELLGPGSVTCLSVQGNRAVIGAVFPQAFGTSWLIYLVDNGFGADIIGYEQLDGTPVTVCPPPGGHEDHRVLGNIIIIDAPALPTTKDQCKNGGWRNYPQFTNQGQCVAFVNHGPSTSALEAAGLSE